MSEPPFDIQAYVLRGALFGLLAWCATWGIIIALSPLWNWLLGQGFRYYWS